LYGARSSPNKDRREKKTRTKLVECWEEFFAVAIWGEYKNVLICEYNFDGSIDEERDESVVWD
jgi:hypothetical protein